MINLELSHLRQYSYINLIFSEKINVDYSFICIAVTLKLIIKSSKSRLKEFDCFYTYFTHCRVKTLIYQGFLINIYALRGRFDVNFDSD